MSGRVHLVGAGPGDPGLITVKGLAALRVAEVVVYDHLASPFLLNEIAPTAERIYVGKRAGAPTLGQQEIQQLLVERAREGRRVVRLKGGDPFLFGRGGEEAEALAAAGIPFEIVPGVTSALAVPAYAGIPVTHRGVSSSVLIATGHLEGDGSAATLSVGADADTVVLLMARRRLAANVATLLAAGREAGTPAALVRWGSTPDQETLVASLGEIVERAEEHGFESPVVLVVGEVVRLRERLRWWDRRPLFGQRVLVTRARDQASDLVQALEAEGASTVSLPTIESVPPASWDALDRALRDIEHYDWVVFTSANAVRWCFARLDEIGGDLRDLKGVRIAAVGSSTADTVRARGIRVDVVPRSYRAEGLLDAFAGDPQGVRGKRILIPRAAVAREILPQELERAGAAVTVAEAYRTTKPQVPVAALLEDLRAGRIHWITFTSSSTVRNFVEALGGAVADGTLALSELRVACIGPLTAETARDLGLRVDVMAEESTIPALVGALVNHVRG